MIMLMAGVLLAMLSGWFDQEAIGTMSREHAQSATAVSSRLFAVATVFITLTILELQHSKTVARLRELEQEIATLRGRTVHA